MDWNLKENRKCLLWLIVFCALVPHGILWLVQTGPAAAFLSPAEKESLANFFLSQWLPFWMVFLPYLRVQKKDTVSLLPTILGGLLIASYYGRWEIRAIAMTMPLVLVMELSALLKRAEASKSRIPAALASDRGMLRAFFFWGIGYPCIALISCEASTWYIPAVSPFLMLPVPAALLAEVFRYQKQQKLTLWGGIGMLAMVPVSLYLVTIGPMARFMAYHLMSLGAGFGIVFLLLIVYSLVP